MRVSIGMSALKAEQFGAEIQRKAQDTLNREGEDGRVPMDLDVTVYGVNNERLSEEVVITVNNDDMEGREPGSPGIIVDLEEN